MKIARKVSGVSVTSLEEDKTMVVSFEAGSLRSPVAESLRRFLYEGIQAKIDDGYQHIVLNFQNIEDVDATGFLLVVIASKVTTSRDAKLYLCNIGPAVARVLNTMGISKHLSIFDTEEDALARVKKRV